MSNYTAADFAKATEAHHPRDRRFARRVDDDGLPWNATVDSDGHHDWLSDSDMADDGWVPGLPAPEITLTSLAAAWNSAEAGVPREGDVVIEGYSSEDGTPRGDSFDVYRTSTNWSPDAVGGRLVRILSRAPGMTNAERLKALYNEWVQDVHDEAFTEFLNRRGVRAPKGDD